MHLLAKTEPWLGAVGRRRSTSPAQLGSPSPGELPVVHDLLVAGQPRPQPIVQLRVCLPRPGAGEGFAFVNKTPPAPREYYSAGCIEDIGGCNSHQHHERCGYPRGRDTLPLACLASAFGVFGLVRAQKLGRFKLRR